MSKRDQPLDADPHGDPFPRVRLLEVEVELDPADWDLIRSEARSLILTATSCPQDFDYTWAVGTVTVDGTRIEEVRIRKKGYLGSVSNTRPSLKLDFGRLVKGRTFRGERRMNLNNDRQDPSHVRQIVTYDRFRAAGLPTLNCCLAHVTVNGDDLGVYTHVESLKESFLERTFGDARGALYEGQLGDFHDNRLAGFQRKPLSPKKKKKKGKKEQDEGIDDLYAVIDALAASGDDVLPALREVLDVDVFLTYWAMEVITGHWDSYSGNANNYLLYKHRGNGWLYFLVSGADATLTPHAPMLPPGIPASTFAMSELCYALYSQPATRALYHARLQELLDRLWDPRLLRAQIDYLAALAQSEERDLEEPRTFVESRKQRILAELRDGGPDWKWPPKRESDECKPYGPIHGRFAADFGSIGEFASSDAAVSFSVQGVPQELCNLQVAIGPFAASPRGELEILAIRLTGTNQDGVGLEVQIRIACPRGNYPAQEVAFHGFESAGLVLRGTDILGFVGDGGLAFEAAGTAPGESVAGTFEGLSNA